MTWINDDHVIIYNFNSHAHVERDSWLMVYACYIFYFNSHAHVERDVYMLYYRSSKGNFNSHAHVERDAQCIGTPYAMQISTHTLTWSVTLDVVYIWCLLHVMRTYFFI